MIFSDGRYYDCFARGNLKKSKQRICVGDFVEFDDGVIIEVYERFSAFNRPNVVNIDCVNIVIGSPPKPDFLLIDKIICASVCAGAHVCLTVNKSDLGQSDKDYVYKNYSDAVDKIFLVSAKTLEGIDELRQYLMNKTVVFAGQSAVGKTSLTNVLFNKENKVGSVSEKTLRGRHTTTYSEIHLLGDCKICDTPGFSQVALTFKSEKLKDYYRDFDSNACYFIDCKHVNEPDCHVKEKVVSGEISKDRYDRYVQIYNEMKEEEKHAKY